MVTLQRYRNLFLFFSPLDDDALMTLSVPHSFNYAGQLKYLFVLFSSLFSILSACCSLLLFMVLIAVFILLYLISSQSVYTGLQFS